MRDVCVELGYRIIELLQRPVAARLEFVLGCDPPLPDPTIFVDADACPVKDEAMRVAERLGLVITFVSNGGVRPSRDPMVRVVVVAAGADVADDWIVEHAAANDIVLTADIPLASRAIDKGCHVLGFTGKPFTAASIGMALAMRDLKQHLRQTGEIKGYNPGFRPTDRSAFLSSLDMLGRKAKAQSDMGRT